MKTNKGINPARRLEMGAAILAAARVVDTTLVSARLAAFARAHRGYADAQQQVEAAEKQLRDSQVRLALRDAEQDRAVEILALRVANTGQPRSNPFAAFGIASPSTIKQMTPAAEAKAIHQLVTVIQQRKGLGREVQTAAAAAEAAAKTVDTTAGAVQKLQSTWDTCRQARDGIGQIWAVALAALKRGARSAADEGAPDLYAALFERPHRPVKKKSQPVTPPDPQPQPTPTPVPTPSPEPIAGT